MRLLQRGLNQLLGNKIVPLVEDGIVGKNTRNATKVLRQETVSRMERKGYVIDKSGTEIVGIRLGAFTNTFKDVGLIIIGEQEYAFPMSTVAGLYGKGNVMNPNWIDGVYGVGVIKEGQYLDCYNLQGPWWSGENFLYQIRNMDFYRDGDLDTEIDRNQVYTGIKGFNFHSWARFEADEVNNLSQGCQVTIVSVWNEIVEPLLYKLHEAQGDITYTLLHLDDFTK
jgi:hypothetical protein